MASSPDDEREIVRQLDAEGPRLVIVSQSVKPGRGWFWDLEVGREAYEDLAPVWQYVDAHYQVGTRIGDDEWGYAVYEPRSGSP
jgi:hypothetical protein